MSGFESTIWCPVCQSVNGAWTDNGFTTCNKCGRSIEKSIFEDSTSQVEDFTAQINTRMGFLEVRLREIDVVLIERLSRGSGNSCVSCGVLTPKSINMCSLCLKKHDDLEREHKDCSRCVDKKTIDHKLILWCPDCQEVKDVKIDNGIHKCNACDRLLISVREACRRRIPLDGVDAECLEHALTQTEQELSALRRELNQVKSEADDTMIVLLETRTKLKHAKEEIEQLMELCYPGYPA